MPTPRLALAALAPALRVVPRVVAALLGAALVTSDSRAVAATDLVIGHAELAVAFSSPVQCHVRLQVTVDGPRDRPLDHRLMIQAATAVTAPRITGARATAPTRVGRTLGLVLADRADTYAIEYTVRQPHEARFRCPVWLPAVPTQAGPGRVRLQVSLPAGAAPSGSRFPMISWTGSRGEVMLGDVPSVIRATFTAPGEDLGWSERLDPARTADLLAIVTLGGGSLFWAVGKRRRRR